MAEKYITWRNSKGVSHNVTDIATYKGFEYGRSLFGTYILKNDQELKTFDSLFGLKMYVDEMTKKAR